MTPSIDTGHKVITLKIFAFDGWEAEGINDAIGDILEREDWRVLSWSTRDATVKEVLDTERDHA